MTREIFDEEDSGGEARTKDDSSASAPDLTGIHALLHPLALEYAREGRQDLEMLLRAMRRVSLNKDGSVAIELREPLRVKGEDVDAIRLRALKARDYFDGTTRDIADTNGFADTVEFATHLVPKGSVFGKAIEELDTLEDAMGVFFGVVALRKNFSSPRR